MGRSKLDDLAAAGADGMSGVASALCAELAVCTWSSPQEVVINYPDAVVDGTFIRIPLGEVYCVDMIANYTAQMILIKFAGPIDKTSQARRPKVRRAA